MAVYTEIRDEELLAFLSQYELGGLHSIKGIAEGVENSNFLLITDAGTFILTLYEKRVDPRDLPWFLDLMTHLAAKGLNCPRPVRMRSGQMLGRLSQRPAAIVTFVDGVSVRRPMPDHCRQLGAILARMHLSAGDFPAFRANGLGHSSWRDLFARADGRADEVEPGLAGLITGELGLLEEVWPARLPQGVIHADLFPDNVFFLGGRLSGLIDFYFACNDLLAYDLAICLNAWCFEPDMAFNITKARALLAGYQGERPLTEEEYEALPILCRGAAMRFLLTRLYDWLNVPSGALVTPKDPREYIARLRFHQGVASARAYGLDPARAVQ